MKNVSYSLALVLGWLGYALYESIIGGATWGECQAGYLAAGESLDPEIRFADAVPAEDNFAAIPELTGITLQTRDGAARRDQLETLGFKSDTTRWPKTRGSRGKNLQLPREDYNLEAVHAYLKETALLDVSSEPPNLAADIYAAISKSHGSLISALHSSSDRPHAVLVPSGSSTSNPDIPLITESAPQTQTLLSLAKGLNLHAVSALRSGHPDEAVASLNSMFRLAEASTADGKQLIGHLVAVAIRTIATDTVWEGIKEEVWDQDQLLKLQKRIESAHPRGDLTDSMRIELIIMIDILDRISSGRDGGELLLGGAASKFPRFILAPWFDHNRAALLTHYDDGYIKPLKQDLPYPTVGEVASRTNERVGARPAWNPRSFVASIAMPALVSAVKRTAEHETQLDQAAIACALERYFIQNNSYPDTLEPLIPDFLDKLPPDPMDHQPIRYEQTDDGRYRLHSVGWDGDDNGGKEGDITWNYTIPVP